jgi:hypothetical protein
LHRQEGIPKGKSKFVRVEAGLAPFLELGQAELKGFLETRSGEALKLIRWLADSPQSISALSQMSASELPSLTALLRLSAIKSAAKYWNTNRMVKKNSGKKPYQIELTFLLRPEVRAGFTSSNAPSLR